MIASKIFLTYSVEQKKKYLFDILSQLKITPEIQDILDLLDSWFSFSDETLDGVFQQLNAVIQEGKMATTERAKDSLRKIHENLEKDSKESSDQADALIDNVEF